MTLDKKAIRFYGKHGAQINAHWSQLNVFMRPRSAAWLRVRNFFRNLRMGRALEKSFR